MNKQLNLYPHNKKSYKKIKESIASGEKIVGIIQATGTGKSYNGLQLTLDNPDKKVLWVTPLNGIVDHIKNIITEENLSINNDFNNLKFISYQKLAQMSDEDIKNIDCDLLIIDEFHHLGAPIWGEKINSLIESHKDIIIFGMTAYTVRDRGTIYERDMINKDTNELFSNKIVHNYNLAEAIVDGVLPPPIYRTSVIEIIDKYVFELEEKLNTGNYTYEELKLYEKYLKDAKKQVHKSSSIPDILKQNIRKNGKYIYFCPVNSMEFDNDIKTIKDKIMSDLIKIGYKEKDIIFYETTSNDEKNGKLNRIAFIKNKNLDNEDVSKKLRIMFVKNQYNEGVHIKGVDGVIFGRGTYSDIVFFEQMGRCLSVDKNDYQDLLQDLDVETLSSIAQKRNLLIDNTITKSNLVDLLSRPTVIDLAGNYEFINNLKDQITGLVKEKVDKTTDTKELKRLYKIIKDLNIEIKDIEILDTLKKLNNNILDTSWERMYKLAKAYYNFHGNLKIPSSFKVEGYENNKVTNLGLWLRRQKEEYKKGHLSSDKVEKLINIGMNFESSKNTLSWNEMYELAKYYYHKHGNLEVPSTYIVEDHIKNQKIPLGTWIRTQRREYQRGTLSEERIKKLEAIKMRFKNKRNTLSWDEMYKLATDYYHKKGNLNVPTNYTIIALDTKVNLSTWIATQKEEYRKNKLSKEKIEKLTKIGLNFDQKRNTLSWDEMYELAVSYYNYHHNLNIPTNYKIKGYNNTTINLGAWVKTQRLNYNAGTLSEERIKKLEAIKMNFNKKRNNISWDEMYELLKAYYNYHGNINIPVNYKLEGYNENITNLGLWLHRQKNNYRNGELTEERINKLNELKIDWEPKRKK